MSIWKRSATVEDLNTRIGDSMAGNIGIRFTEIGDDYLTATMPVNEYTRQHRGILHGGASVVLAETIGSIASLLCTDEDHTVVGLEINANHLRPGTDTVTGTTRPLHIGRRTMVWEIRIENAAGKLVCVSRITTAVVPAKS